jgi:hypothetical protein
MLESERVFVWRVRVGRVGWLWLTSEPSSRGESFNGAHETNPWKSTMTDLYMYTFTQMKYICLVAKSER